MNVRLKRIKYKSSFNILLQRTLLLAGGIECGPQLIPELMEGTIADLNLVNSLPSLQKNDSCSVRGKSHLIECTFELSIGNILTSNSRVTISLSISILDSCEYWFFWILILACLLKTLSRTLAIIIKTCLICTSAVIKCLKRENESLMFSWSCPRTQWISPF